MDASTKPHPLRKVKPFGGPLCHVTAVVTRIAAAVANVFTMLSAYLVLKVAVFIRYRSRIPRN